MSRRFLPVVATLVLALAGGSAAAAEPSPYPANTILLFVASWCAPCRAEIARLDAIAEAARPWSVRVVLLDGDRAGRMMVRSLAPARRWLPDAAVRRRVEDDLFAGSAGLPYSLMTDANGTPCASRRDGLDAARTRSLVQACARQR